MRGKLRGMALASTLAIGGALGIGVAPAQAHDYGGNGGHGGVPYGAPVYRYYGNGGHDLQPHWHTKRTPFGTFQYFGNGPHDLRPHGHTVTPYGIESYNGRRTRSYSPPTPYGFQPW